MNVVSLASGSKGNAYIVEQDAHALLVDCGLGPRIFKARMSEFFSADIRFHGVLLTHNHSDHISGLKAFLKSNPDVPVYANEMTADAVVYETGVSPDAFVRFENGQDFDVGPFYVEPFSVPHDASDPVGYLIKGKKTYFHATDIGTPIESAGKKFASASLATIEFNHDSQMLHTSGRLPSLIRRIAGPRGHLSNDEAAEFITKWASPLIEKVALAHLSQDCNVAHLALEAASSALTSKGLNGVAVEVFCQDKVVAL
jgi:phosphoribosyl 1,2-cyclic phosphodiesterase